MQSDEQHTTPASDREFLLDDALHQAIHTIEFLHGCLTDEQFSYEYPQMTKQELIELRELVSPRQTCFHSKLQTGSCEACKQHVERLDRRAALQD